MAAANVLERNLMMVLFICCVLLFDVVGCSSDDVLSLLWITPIMQLFGSCTDER